MTDVTSPTAQDAAVDDVRPRVAIAPSRMPLYAFIAVAVVGGIALFSSLDARRREITAPSTRPAASDLVGLPSTIPEIYIPPTPVVQSQPLIVPRTATPAASPLPVARSSIPSAMPYAQAAPVPVYTQQTPAAQLPAAPSSGPAVVYDSASRDGNGEGAKTISAQTAAGVSGVNDGARVTAGRFANPGTTIPQGAIIHAVLETALDSTRPGLVRAIISEDVRGFDGLRVLVPRGARLIGEYGSSANPGQNRALVMWTRLIRPDGVTIALQSPVADPLGRAGVRASVNSHFLERFSGAILQSALQVGVNAASRRIYDGTLVLGLPGSTTNVPAIPGTQSDITPTLKVRHGTSVAVFVARDLDFTLAEGAR